MLKESISPADSIGGLRVEAWRQALVGPHFGVIEALERVAPEADDLSLAVFAGRLCRTSAWAPADAPRAVSGAALNEADALAACVGEALERYSAALVAPRTLLYERIDRLQGEAISPERFPLFTRRQYRQSRALFPFEPWHPQMRLTWIPADRIPAGQQVWVPAVFVHQPFRPHEDEPMIAPSLSTGLAAGCDESSATIAALCEVIERDAVALAWLGKIRPRRIEITEHDGEESLGRLIHELNSRGFRWSVFDLTTDLRVPVVAALIEGKSSLGPIVSFGSACHSEPARAALKALVEAAHCRMYVKSLMREQPDWSVGRRFEHVTTFADHARFYTSHPQYRRVLDRWWKTPHVVAWDEMLSLSNFPPLPPGGRSAFASETCSLFPPGGGRAGDGGGERLGTMLKKSMREGVAAQHPLPAGEGEGVRERVASQSGRSEVLHRATDLPALLARISAAGYDALRLDLTPPDLAPLGFHVVRVLIPGLQPLHGNHAWPHLAGPRLRMLRSIFGPGARQPWRFNPFPHPCP